MNKRYDVAPEEALITSISKAQNPLFILHTTPGCCRKMLALDTEVRE
jgi:hypothetical protein